MTQQQIEALYKEIRTLKEQKNAVILAHYYACLLYTSRCV